MASSQSTPEPSEASPGNETAINREQNEGFLWSFLTSFIDSPIDRMVRDAVTIVQDLFRAKPHVVKCPFSDSNVISTRLGHDGGILTSKNGDVKVDVPKGAIKEGDLVKFYVATNSYGSFVLPAKGDLVSPYFWIGVSELYNFKKLVRVEFEHFAFVTITNLSHYQLLCCEDDDVSHTMKPVEYNLGVKSQGDRSFFTYLTNHLCSYCLLHNGEGPVINRISVICLKPRNYQRLDDFTVEIWFSFPNGSSMRRNEELYTKKGLILDEGCSYIFEASCHANSKGYFSFNYIQNLDGWFLSHSLSRKILTKEINFYNCYANAENLHASEENLLYPPRFVIHVVKKFGCSRDLDTDIMVMLYNHEDPITFKPFRIFVSVMVINFANMLTTNFLPHQCGDKESTPSLQELVKYSKKMAYHWKEIGITLGIPDSVVSIIDIDHRRMENKCFAMFSYWVEVTDPPHCWCHFIQALYSVGLYQVAEEASKHLEAGQLTEETYKGAISSVVSLTPNLYRLMRYLKDIPDDHFNYFITYLLPKESAIELIKDIKHSSRSKSDNMKKLCEAFLKEENATWTKVHEALIKAECDDLADVIEACFLHV